MQGCSRCKKPLALLLYFCSGGRPTPHRHTISESPPVSHVTQFLPFCSVELIRVPYPIRDLSSPHSTSLTPPPTRLHPSPSVIHPPRSTIHPLQHPSLMPLHHDPRTTPSRLIFHCFSPPRCLTRLRYLLGMFYTFPCPRTFASFTRN